MRVRSGDREVKIQRSIKFVCNILIVPTQYLPHDSDRLNEVCLIRLVAPSYTVVINLMMTSIPSTCMIHYAVRLRRSRYD